MNVHIQVLRVTAKLIMLFFWMFENDFIASDEWQSSMLSSMGQHFALIYNMPISIAL